MERMTQPGQGDRDPNGRAGRFPALAAMAACLLAWSAAGAAEHEAKVVIPFPLVSKFDGGRYGQLVADGVWKKLSQEKRFVIPDSLDDVKRLCDSGGIAVGPDTPLAEVERIVRQTFDAQIGIWGSIERAPGAEGEIYDFSIRCVDFSTPGQPKVIYEKMGVRTRSVSEIPHVHVKEMLDRLCERAAPLAPGPHPDAEAAWKKGKNLVVGDFEQASRGVPRGWEARAGQRREPLGNLVKLVPEAGNPANHVLRFTIPKEVAEAEGVMYYSLPFPVREGATYRFQCRWRTTGPSPKVFIKCYDEMPSEYRGATKAGEVDGPAPGAQAPAVEPREVYRSQQNLKGPSGVWNVHTEDFTPKHTKYSPRMGRIMLYGYLTEGVLDWDDVVLKEILPPPPDFNKGERRHSQASKVTLQEMEQNERRGAEARQTLRRESQPKAKKSGPSRDGSEE